MKQDSPRKISRPDLYRNTAVYAWWTLREEFKLTDILKNLLSDRRFQWDPVAAIAIIVFNRLLVPKSELAISNWYDGLWWPRLAATPLHGQRQKTMASR